jgi:hypothetical protein
MINFWGQGDGLQKCGTLLFSDRSLLLRRSRLYACSSGKKMRGGEKKEALDFKELWIVRTIHTITKIDFMVSSHC